MKTLTYSVRAVFSEARAGAYEKMFRIRAGTRAIFAWADNIAGLERLEAVSPGAEVFMGVAPLVDGTFKLYWLHLPEVGSFAAQTLSNRTRQDMDTVLGGDTSHCVPLEDLEPGPDPDAGAERKFIADLEQAPPPATPATFYRAEGEAARISVSAKLRLMPKARMDPYLSYAFTCAGRQLHFTFSNEKSAASPLHPFFLAEGDRIRAVVGEDERTIQALLNLEDGCRYLRTVGAYASWRWVKHQLKNALGVSACIIAVALLGVLAFAMPYNIFLTICGVALFIGAVMGAGAYLENYLGTRFGRGRADLLRILDALDVTGSGREKPPYVHILEARYPIGKPDSSDV